MKNLLPYILCAIFGIGSIAGTYKFMDKLIIETQPVQKFTDQVQKSIKGVVHLETPEATGSGFVAGPRLIVTARHCVEGVEDFLITTVDGHQVRATRAISDKEHDVAFVWVDDLMCVAGERGTVDHSVVLSPLPIGSIKDCVLGQGVYVIGSTFGFENFNRVCTGIISGLGVDWGDEEGWSIGATGDYSAGPGNSGGPIFTMQGVVIGVHVAGIDSTTKYFVPCDLFLANLDSIRLMFALDRYQKEEAVQDQYEYYN